MKKFFQKNKTIMFLLIVIVVCLAVIVGLMLRYFYFGDGSTRTIAQDTYVIPSSELDTIKEHLEAREEVTSASVALAPQSGIVKIRIVFTDGYDLDKAKTVAASTLEEFSEQDLSLYDVMFTLISASTDKADGFTIMGSRNVAGSTLVWNNNNATTTEEEE